MRKAIMFIWILILIFPLCACQPTPEKAVVVGKGNGELENMIAQSGDSAREHETQKHWTDSAEIADLSVTIDADVIMPEVEQYPAAVITATEISQEQADKIMEVFLQGATLYERSPDAPNSKQEVMDEIIRVKAELADPNSEANQWLEQTGSSEKIDYLNSYLAQLEKAYETAPEINQQTPASTKFTKEISPELLAPVAIPDDATEEERKKLEEENANLQQLAEEWVESKIEGAAKLANGKIMTLSITETSARFGAGYNLSELEHLSGLDLPVVECTLTQEQAEQTALDTVGKLGLDHLGIAATTTGFTLEKDASMTPTAKRECYLIFLMRELNGVIGNYAYCSAPVEEQYVELGANESVVMSVDDQGVLSFEWYQPSKLVSVENENVAILPFSEIQEIFKKQILIKGVWNTSSGSDKAVVSRRIGIEEARLGLMRTVRQDKPGEYLLIPVWDFYGYEASKYAERQSGGYILDENNERIAREFGRSYLTINAIDGSVIDRGLGY